jgi:hypothetical protein
MEALGSSLYLSISGACLVLRLLLRADNAGCDLAFRHRKVVYRSVKGELLG